MDTEAEEWDPMKDVAESFMNTVFQINDPGAYNATGQAQLEKNIPCPFYDPKTSTNGKCFKGNNCYYYHGKYSSSILQALPKLALPEDGEEITICTDLPEKELASEGCITIAWVTSSVDPGEFYIIPKDGWNCMCTPVDILADEKGLAYNCAGFNTFEDINVNLQMYMKKNICRLPTTYVSGQLVAVKLSVTTKRKQWFRAIVLEDAIIEGSGESAPDVKLRLLDYGIAAVKKTTEVVPLPKEFCHISAMAFKCRLHGISPITGFWSSRATKKFQDFIQGQFACLEIKQTIQSVDGLFSLFENTPYLVEIHVKYNGNYVNVAERLVEEGLGLQWNFYKWRPFVNEILPYWKYSYMLRKQSSSSKEEEERISQIVKEREESRLEKCIARITVNAE